MGDHAPVAAEEYDYEGLPPNFTLVENMAAGAFAGIAVIIAWCPTMREIITIDAAVGTHPYVSLRSSQGELPAAAGQQRQAPNLPRHDYKFSTHRPVDSTRACRTRCLPFQRRRA